MRVLETKDLVKHYRGRRVIDHVSMTVEEGSVVALLGPNGSGKSTTFHIVSGLVPPDEGSVVLSGRDITHLPMYKRARLGVGYIPQDSSIFKRLSVEDNIYAILELQKHFPTKAAKKERLETLLEEFKITHIRKSLGMSLSGGEQRRTEVARALASNPHFLLFDEPFAGVDPIAVHDMKIVIRELAQRGVGILITDHNVRETLAICDHAYIMGAGKMLAQGSEEEIYESPIVRHVYLGENFDAPVQNFKQTSTNG